MNAIRAVISELFASAHKYYDDNINGPDPDGNKTYPDARAPEGEDFNEIYGMVGFAESKISKIVIGRLWWVADSDAEFVTDMARYTAAGAVVTKVERDGPRVQYVIELEKVKALAILGYVPEDGEWLIEDSDEGESRNAAGESPKMDQSPSKPAVDMTFHMNFTVDDEAAFRRRARQACLKGGEPAEVADTYLDEDKQSLEECAQMIFDPGSSEGISIDSSLAERFASPADLDALRESLSKN